MRIVGGRFGGRHLRVPVGKGTRPTAERVREAIASLLSARDAIEGASVLELYAGTGALGFELLSRGAAHVVFVEKDGAMAHAIKAAGDELAVSDQLTVLRADASKERAQADVLARGPYSLVVADPPYRDAATALALLAALSERGLLSEGALLLLETSAKQVPSLPAAFTLLSHYRYGDTAVALFGSRADPRADLSGSRAEPRADLFGSRAEPRASTSTRGDDLP
jgi:16S rRNA (guanine966-N2)-methyltransferase